MEAQLDIIGIGAINFDFMFSFDVRNEIDLPGGAEELYGTNPEENVRQKISLARNRKKPVPCNVQLGGAAFGAIRSAYGMSISNEHIEKRLEVGYVGVYGKMKEPYAEELVDMGYCNIDMNIKKSFNFLADKGSDFLFEADGQNGIGYFALSSDGTRLNADAWRYKSEIFQGVNKDLYEKIQNKEMELGLDFSDYLARAKWIHISSLVEFNQFMLIIEKIKQAKKSNPSLKVSMDPGSSYMKRKFELLKPAFSVCDFVFLSGLEFKCFQDILDNLDKPQILDNLIKIYFEKDINCCFVANIGKGTYRIIRIKDNRVFINNISYSSYKTSNDTGSGSSFAGGFILANIDSNACMESPIVSGNQAEGMRLVSKESPYETIDLKTGETIDIFQKIKEAKMKMERNIMKKKKIFISHSVKDSALIDKFLSMLESVRIDNQYVFCSSIYGYGVNGLGKEAKFHEHLKKELSEENALVLFVLSNNFFESKYSLFELGATWVLDRDWYAMLMPGYDYSTLPNSLPIEISGAIGIDLSLAKAGVNERNILEEKLDVLKEAFLKHLSLPNIDGTAWKRARNDFIEIIKEKF